MSGDQGRERKVRGGRIRDSRSEKRRRSDSGGPGPGPGPGRRAAGGPGDGAGPVEAEVSLASLAGQTLPDAENFVETDAVEETLSRVGRWLSVGRPVHLIGPTGCGKTTLAVAAARRRDRPVVFINGDADLSTADLVGDYAGEERHSVRDRYVHNVHKSTDVVRERWVDNPLTVAVREGATLVYNEFSRTKPVANNVLLSVFEEGVLELPGRRGEDRYVDVHPEFRAVLTSNSAEYAGVHQPQDALLDRLIGVHVDFYDADTEEAIVMTRVDVDAETARAVVETVRAARETLSVTVGTRAAVMAAEGMAAVPPEERSRDLLVDVCTDVLSSKVPDRSGLEDLRDGLVTIVADREFEADWATDRRT